MDPSHPINPIDYMTHGYTAIVMMIDFLISKQPYYALHALYYILFGVYYTLFTLFLFVSAGCLSDAKCDVDGNGNPYVYAVFDWTDPQGAVTTGLMSLVVAATICQAFFRMSKRLGANMGFM